MTGQIAGPSIFSLELVGLVIGVSMIVGAVDLIRKPGWAWKRAEESKAAYLVLVLLLPLVGLGMYLYSARPKVAPIAAAGRAASLPFERFGEDADHKHREEQREDGWPAGTVAPPTGFGSFGATTVSNGQILLVEAPRTEASSDDGPEPDDRPEPVEVSSTFFSTGSVATRTLRSPVGLARTYRPKQRTSLAVAEETRATVPAGWKADPTGRHQFRYWDGFQWTENVADAGQQSRDSVSA
jgi:Protein of unknown function (DUF2510)